MIQCTDLGCISTPFPGRRFWYHRKTETVFFTSDEMNERMKGPYQMIPSLFPESPPIAEAEQAIGARDETIERLMKRLGIETLPASEIVPIALDHLIIPNEGLRPSARLVKSVKRVGILQPPAVVVHAGSALHAPDATYTVIFGRRRVLAARQAKLPVIRCVAYHTGTPQLFSLLALIENEQRSSAWIKEVVDLRRLIDERVGMTMDELVDVGFDRGTLTERLKMAQLPQPVLTLLAQGKVPRAVAKKVLKLTPLHMERVVEQIQAGEALTAELVTTMFRRQVNDGLVALQPLLDVATASHALQGQGSASEHPAQMASEDPSRVQMRENSIGHPQTPLTPSAMLATLTTFAQQLRATPATQNIRLLLRTLIQEMEVACRTAQPLLQHDEPTPEKKEHSSHV
jgi:ParB/RepB/Spo0J family partition protein